MLAEAELAKVERRLKEAEAERRRLMEEAQAEAEAAKEAQAGATGKWRLSSEDHG